MRLTVEWQELTAFAFILLTANVSFLSIQSVDQSGGVARSPAQIASYLSIVTSSGSMILGLLLLKQTRNRDRETPAEAAEFIRQHTHPTLGLEKLAILYSLPFALLFWSLLSFLVAICAMCFGNSSAVTRVLVIVFCAVVAGLIVWCIFTGWEGSDRLWLNGLFSARDRVDEENIEDTTEGDTQRSKHSRKLWSWLSKIRRKISDSSAV